jgi:hypothetical protein
MAYTQADLDSVTAAILKLANGRRSVSVAFADGRRVDYQPVNLAELRTLKAEIANEVGNTDGSARVRQIRANFCRGF